MNKLKLIIVLFALILFASQVKAQEQLQILFAVGDTTETVNIPGNANTVFITVSDSAIAGTDSVSVLAVTKSTRTLKSPVATHSLNATSPTTYIATYMIPGDGATVTYSFDAKAVPGGLFEIYRSNQVLQAGRCRISVNFK